MVQLDPGRVTATYIIMGQPFLGETNMGIPVISFVDRPDFDDIILGAA
jgi:hypothetical protein